MYSCPSKEKFFCRGCNAKIYLNSLGIFQTCKMGKDGSYPFWSRD